MKKKFSFKNCTRRWVHFQQQWLSQKNNKNGYGLFQGLCKVVWFQLKIKYCYGGVGASKHWLRSVSRIVQGSLVLVEIVAWFWWGG